MVQWQRKPVASVLDACFISLHLKYKSIYVIFTWVSERWRIWDIPLKERMAFVSTGTSTLLNVSILFNHIHYLLCPRSTWKCQCLDVSPGESWESLLLGNWKLEGWNPCQKRKEQHSAWLKKQQERIMEEKCIIRYIKRWFPKHSFRDSVFERFSLSNRNTLHCHSKINRHNTVWRLHYLKRRMKLPYPNFHLFTTIQQFQFFFSSWIWMKKKKKEIRNLWVSI